MNRYICPKCGGEGRVYDHVFGLVTLGIGYIIQFFDSNSKMICPKCRGYGYV